MQQVSIGSSSHFHFPKDITLFLDTKNITSLQDNIYPYMYMFNDINSSFTWIRMEQCEEDKKYYFRGTVPEDKYSGLIFTLQKNDNSGWENCNIKTCNIMYSNFDESKNCYTLYNQYNNGNEIHGSWKHSFFFTGEQFFLDTSNIKDWKNPYVYMFNDKGEHNWQPLTEYINQDSTNNLFKFTFDDTKYFGLVFTSQEEEENNAQKGEKNDAKNEEENNGSWEKCIKQTVDIYRPAYHDRNVYVLDNNTQKITYKLNKITKPIFLYVDESVRTLANNMNMYVYAYLYNASGHDWIKMNYFCNITDPNTERKNQKTIKSIYMGIVPAIKYDNIIFSFNSEDCGNFEKSYAQTSDCNCNTEDDEYSYNSSSQKFEMSTDKYEISSNNKDNNNKLNNISNNKINLTRQEGTQSGTKGVETVP